MPEEKKNPHTTRLAIKGVPTKIKEQLDNLADNKGLTTSGFLKSEINKILQQYPDEMKKKRDEQQR